MVVRDIIDNLEILVQENLKLKSEIEKLKLSIDSISLINQKLEKKISTLLLYYPKKKRDYMVKEEFKNIKFSYAALQKLLDDYEFTTVLDIGAGSLDHSKVFSQYGKRVTAIDLGLD